jgi:hypothetical protein
VTDKKDALAKSVVRTGAESDEGRREIFSAAFVLADYV